MFVWMPDDKTQCCPAEVKGIQLLMYSPQRRFAGAVSERLVCFNLSLKCQKTAVSAKCLYWITPSLLFTRMDSWNTTECTFTILVCDCIG
jgi:hypothetical protein